MSDVELVTNVSDNLATVGHVLQQLENSFSTIIDTFC